MSVRGLNLVLLGTALLLAAGCEDIMRDMYDQPKYSPLAPSSLFPDRRSARPPVSDTVARAGGTWADTTSGRLGGIEPADPPRVTPALLARGRERFDIYCSPCHSRTGDGDGMVVQRGFPAPPSYHIPRLRAAPDRHFFDVITNGHGAMASYASRVPPSDRWAIVAYIRALQFSRNAPLAAVPPAERRALESAP